MTLFFYFSSLQSVITPMEQSAVMFGQITVIGPYCWYIQHKSKNAEKTHFMFLKPETRVRTKHPGLEAPIAKTISAQPKPRVPRSALLLDPARYRMFSYVKISFNFSCKNSVTSYN